MKNKMYNKRTVLTILIFFWLIFNAQAQSDDLANWQYESALAAYQRGDCKNASIHVKIAFDRYTSAGNTVGISQCNQLILRINDCLKMLGDSYYIQALDYYAKAEDSLRARDYINARKNLDQALIQLNLANSTYNYLLPVDVERVAKVNNKYSDTRSKIRESELMKAYDLYDKAVYYIEKRDYVTALSFVDNASGLCSLYSDQDCVQRCATLRAGLLDEVSKISERARYLYEKGVEAYTTANCSNEGYFVALRNFEEAKKTFILIKDYKSAEDSDYILKQVNTSLYNCAQQMLLDIDKSIQEVRTDLVLARDDCSKYAEIEKKINAIKAKAGDLYNRFHMYSFADRSGTCKRLLNELSDKKAKCSEIETAEKKYSEAYSFFKQAEYEKALVSAKEAHNIFIKGGDYGGVTKSEKLIDDTLIMLTKLNESNAYYNKALEYYNRADFNSALIYAKIARQAYLNISRMREVELCDKTISDITQGNATKNRADEYYDDARRYLEYREYGTALEKAELALDLYKKIKYGEGIKKSQDLIKSIPPQQSSPPILAILVVVSVVAITLLWMRSNVVREKKEKEMEEEKLRLMEEKRRAEEEAERRKKEEERQKIMLERQRIKELLEKDKQMKIQGEESKIPADRVSEIHREQKDVEDLDDERKRLEAILQLESESIRKEKSIISESIGLGSNKRIRFYGKQYEEKESDREKIKDIILDKSTQEGNMPSKEPGEYPNLREAIKRERSLLNKRSDEEDSNKDGS